MIDDELLSKFNLIQDLLVSEEMLGAYLEGNLDLDEQEQVERILEESADTDFISSILSVEPEYVDAVEYDDLSEYVEVEADDADCFEAPDSDFFDPTDATEMPDNDFMQDSDYSDTDQFQDDMLDNVEF